LEGLCRKEPTVGTPCWGPWALGQTRDPHELCGYARGGAEGMTGASF